MPKYRNEFSFLTREWGDIELIANNREDAEYLTKKYVQETYEDAEDIVIERMAEVFED